MGKDICINKICSLPLDFIVLDKSASLLVNESQLIIYIKDIILSEIEDYLSNHLDLIEMWKDWSNNKRTRRGVYLSMTEKGNLVGYIDYNGKKIFERSFYSPIEACAEFILSEASEILHSDFEFQLDVLINASIEIGNLMRGIVLNESSIIYFAEGLSQKIINHILTARYLINGYQPSDSECLYDSFIDFTSIIVLTRAALETYLTLNYIFIAEGNEDQRQFRFKCWDLAGYIEREKFQVKEKANIELKENEQIAIESLKKELYENSIFRTLPITVQKKALKGEWRLHHSWRNLAIKAGYSDSFFSQEYKFLCTHAHASRLSVIQIQQSKTFKQQKEMTSHCTAILLFTLAKHMYDYIEIMPQLNSVKKELAKYSIILYWKNFGDLLQQPELMESAKQ